MFGTMACVECHCCNVFGKSTGQKREGLKAVWRIKHNEIKEVEMNGTGSMVESPKGKDHFGDICLDEKIILKYILKGKCVSYGLESTVLGQSSGGFCVHCTKYSGTFNLPSDC
jgi:hypothetical protein